MENMGMIFFLILLLFFALYVRSQDQIMRNLHSPARVTVTYTLQPYKKYQIITNKGQRFAGVYLNDVGLGVARPTEREDMLTLEDGKPTRISRFREPLVQVTMQSFPQFECYVQMPESWRVELV